MCALLHQFSKVKVRSGWSQSVCVPSSALSPGGAASPTGKALGTCTAILPLFCTLSWRGTQAHIVAPHSSCTEQCQVWVPQNFASSALFSCGAVPCAHTQQCPTISTLFLDRVALQVGTAVFCWLHTLSSLGSPLAYSPVSMRSSTPLHPLD